ncbi:MAG: GspH/FimT family pseudopilin [Armatimonadota bacterium]|nr:GspH/FimT family pseudopilin [Armatimonadota bacterium]MDR7520767.1 GspH/FimT family pseudopilin [Armatimonadota bacterium]MDR7549236.1 GspH/FimT family pseudopilin [Armatimonadota bacterium]
MRGGDGGFSFAEALVVAALLAILIVVAAPRPRVPESLQVSAPARELTGDLRLAQRLAIARRTTYVVEFSPSVAPYQSYTVRPQLGSPEPDFPKLLPAGVAVTGPQQFSFRPDGSAAAGGTVTLVAGGATATVQVYATTGRVVVTLP